MKQLLILSGKGGTGKTTIASAFIQLSGSLTFADCDVDAPNLHLLMNQNLPEQKSDFYGLSKADINPGVCIECDLCSINCCFDAIYIKEGYKVNLFACEGCGVCEEICPVDAITMMPSISGTLKLFDNHKVFSTAELKMGSGNSGKLVTEVKKQMMKNAKGEIAIIDGSPGIGCPVIASLSGVHMVLIVAEPSVSGISDMKRIIDTALRFNIKIAVCINKYDINIEKSEKIIEYCRNLNIPIVGTIPFDKNVNEAVNSGKSIIDIECEAGNATKGVFNKTIELLLK